MARTASLSGFPEWLPEERLVELHVLDTLRRTFELHGFSSIETRAVETVGQLLRKGEIDKEVYGLSRLQDDEGEAATDARRASTIRTPLPCTSTSPSRSPGTSWKTPATWPSRSAATRSRRSGAASARRKAAPASSPRRTSTLWATATCPSATTSRSRWSSPRRSAPCPIPDFRLRINNRKLAEGFYRGIGLTDTAGVLRSIDKLEKIGPAKVAELLKTELGATDEQAQAALKLAGIRTEDTSFVAQVRALGVSNELLEEGLNELEQVIDGRRAARARARWSRT